MICKLAAVANGTSPTRQFITGIPYSNLHLTVTGTSPLVDVELV